METRKKPTDQAAAANKLQRPAEKDDRGEEQNNGNGTEQANFREAAGTDRTASNQQEDKPKLQYVKKGRYTHNNLNGYNDF